MIGSDFHAFDKFFETFSITHTFTPLIFVVHDSRMVICLRVLAQCYLFLKQVQGFLVFLVGIMLKSACHVIARIFIRVCRGTCGTGIVLAVDATDRETRQSKIDALVRCSPFVVGIVTQLFFYTDNNHIGVGVRSTVFGLLGNFSPLSTLRCDRLYGCLDMGVLQRPDISKRVPEVTIGHDFIYHGG